VCLSEKSKDAKRRVRILESTDENRRGEENVVERSNCGGVVYLVSLGGPEKTMMREILASDYQNRIMEVLQNRSAEKCEDG
jgi:hypothetical protein